MILNERPWWDTHVWDTSTLGICFHSDSFLTTLCSLYLQGLIPTGDNSRAPINWILAGFNGRTALEGVSRADVGKEVDIEYLFFLLCLPASPEAALPLEQLSFHPVLGSKPLWSCPH